jgi:hypothetical protein
MGRYVHVHGSWILSGSIVVVMEARTPAWRIINIVLQRLTELRECESFDMEALPNSTQ